MSAETKYCGMCDTTKSCDAFYKRGDGLRSECKECCKKMASKWIKEHPAQNRARSRKWASEHPDEIRQRSKTYYEDNADAIKARSGAYYDSNKDKIAKSSKRYRARNQDTIKVGKKKWYDANSERLKERARERYAADPERYKAAVKEQRAKDPEKAKANANRRTAARKNDPQFIVKRTLRRRLNHVVTHKGLAKSGSAVTDLGCSVDEFITYIEGMFVSNPRTGELMTWQNHAINGWHLDHIVPLSHFDLRDGDQLKIACHYLNIQPLWADDNLSKGDKLPNNAKELIEKIAEIVNIKTTR
jgi:hypothetical protein